MAQIILKISPDGQIKAETVGAKGKQCTKYIGVIENLTDAHVTDSEFTSEFLEEAISAGVENNAVVEEDVKIL